MQQASRRLDGSRTPATRGPHHNKNNNNDNNNNKSAGQLRLPPLQKVSSAPQLQKQRPGKEEQRRRQQQHHNSLPRIIQKEGSAVGSQSIVPSPAVAPSVEARQALFEVLSNPNIQKVAQRYYNLQLPDRQSGGRLGFKDLRKVLQDLNQHLGVPMPSSAAAEQLFKRFDFNGDGNLAFEEFFELFVSSLRRTAFDRSVLLGREVFVGQEPGNVWDQYHRIRTLGTGSFGAAHLGRHKRTNEERVIKAVQKSQARLPVEDIEREIMVMLRLDHPHVIRLYGWYEGSSTIYLIMDALKGGTLRDALLQQQSTGHSVEEGWSRNVMSQVLQAMAYCHSMRVIHKDLKDENVMLLKQGFDTGEPFVVIIDLGVAEMFSLSEPRGKLMGGSPMTMAPEVWRGNFGAKCDVWSAGCILFEMLSGGMPFMARSLNPRDWMALHKYGPNWRKVATSSQSRSLCQEMLTFADSARPSMAACLKHPWFSARPDALGLLPAEQLDHLQAFCKESALKRALLMEIAAKLPLDHAERIVKMFNQLDWNKDGGMSQEELCNAFAYVGLRDRALQEKTFQALDVNRDGLLSYSEFAAGVLLGALQAARPEQRRHAQPARVRQFPGEGPPFGIPRGEAVARGHTQQAVCRQ
ncbi:unnamed protein product [Polarella glacialis]|uniref:non-specific serine/threonine protein kinase n=1 Tax=Polarella glacialis TaxID=89957 RepID=A0A813EWN1_POLGL|nr:unnamed protein product [Polarella glacialis]